MQELFSQALTRLVELGQLSPKHVKKASGPVEELVKSLIDGKQLDRVTWLALLSKMTGCKALDLAAFRISPTQAQSITRRVAEDLHLLPIAREDSKLLVAMADPTNVFSLHRVMTLTGLECEPRLVYHVDLQSAIEQAFSVKVDRITAETPTRPKEPEAGGESKTRFMVATRVAPYGGDLNLRMQMVQDLGVSKKVKLEGFVTSRVQPVGIPTSQEESSAMLEQNLLHLLEPSSERERLESILALADRLVRVEGSSLLLLSEDGKQLCFAAVTGPKGQQLRGMRLPLDESSVAGYSLLHRQTICLGDAESDPRQSKKTDEAVGFVTRSLISCPFYLDGAPAGVLQLVNKHVDIFSHQDVHTVQVLAAQAAVAVSVSRQSRQVEALRWRVLNGLRSSMQRSGVCSLEQGEQVASLAARLGQEFLLGERETEVLRMAGFLYRVDLTLLESVGIFADLVPILRGRTDRYDEAGEAQPRLSRILAVVADWVELARSGRSEEAWDRLREGFGTRYDPLLREVMQGLVATREASLR